MSKDLTGRVTERVEMPIPIYIEEGIILRGFHQEVLSGGNEDVEFDVGCGAGLGSDHVSMTWKRNGEDHRCTFWLRDVLKAWVAGFDPEGAEGLPNIKVEIES